MWVQVRGERANKKNGLSAWAGARQRLPTLDCAVTRALSARTGFTESNSAYTDPAVMGQHNMVN